LIDADTDGGAGGGTIVRRLECTSTDVLLLPDPPTPPNSDDER
jgi:hypothetical protein